jgi:hypothetical protein
VYRTRQFFIGLIRGFFFLAKHLTLLICQQPSVSWLWQSGRRRAPDRYLPQGKSRGLNPFYPALS